MMVELGPVTDFIEGRPRAFTINGTDIAVVAWRAKVYAVRNRCPHMHAPLTLGFITPKLCPGASIGTMDVDEDAPVLSCPWHLWQFDLQTGAALADSKYKITAFPTELRDGRVFVDLDRRGPAIEAAATFPSILPNTPSAQG